MAVEKEFKLPKSQYIRKKEFKQKFAEIKPEFMDISEWFDRKQKQLGYFFLKKLKKYYGIFFIFG